MSGQQLLHVAGRAFHLFRGSGREVAHPTARNQIILCQNLPDTAGHFTQTLDMGGGEFYWRVEESESHIRFRCSLPVDDTQITNSAVYDKLNGVYWGKAPILDCPQQLLEYFGNDLYYLLYHQEAFTVTLDATLFISGKQALISAGANLDWSPAQCDSAIVKPTFFWNDGFHVEGNVAHKIQSGHDASIMLRDIERFTFQGFEVSGPEAILLHYGSRPFWSTELMNGHLGFLLKLSKMLSHQGKLHTQHNVGF